MESPPYYSGAPKKSNTGLIIGGIVLALCLCCCGLCGVGGYFAKGVAEKGIGIITCGTALGQQRDGLIKYAAKHGGVLPAAGTWQDDIKPYVTLTPKSDDQPFAIPAPTDDFCDKANGTTIAYNTAVAGKKLDSIQDKSGTVALFETSGRGRNKSDAYAAQSFATSPKLVMDERRGWMRIPLEGEALLHGKNGADAPLSQIRTRGRRGVHIDTNSTTTTTTGD